MNTPDSGPYDEVERLARLACSLWPDVDRGRLRCTPVARTRNSRVYEISDGATLHWAAKVCVDPWTHALSPDAARIQFEALSALRDRTRNAGVALGKPDPVHLDERRALVVMGWVDGQSLTAELKQWPRVSATLDQHVREAGRWLALLHSVGPGSVNPLPTQRKLTGLADALRLSTARDRVFRRAVELLERRAAAAAAEPHPWSWVHGDFKPDNVLFAKGQAAGIDVQLRNVSSVLDDIAPFLNSIEILCTMPRAWRTRTQRDALVSGFLDGYTTVMGPLPPVSLAWARLYAASALWAYDMTIARNPLRAVIVHGLYRRLVRRLSGPLAVTGAASEAG